MRHLPLLLISLLLLGGCASTGDMENLRSQISELQEELAGLKRTSAAKDEVQNVNQRIATQTEQLLRSNATLVAKVDAIDEKVQNTLGTIEQTNYRVDQLGQQVAQAQRDIESMRAAVANAPTSEVTVESAGSGINPPATAANPPSANPADTYNAAYRDYQRGNFDLSIAGFREYLQQNASTDLADNASYWIGESLFSQKKYGEAIQQFDNVITKYPRSDKVPGALLKKGYAYITLGERAQGIVQLQYVVHEHPTSQEAALARQRLKQLGVETR